MEAAQHSTHVPSFPSKLRWRPYANGSSLKSKKTKKEEQQKQQRPSPSAAQDVNAKAVAHRIRAKTPHRSPVEVQLQWEEAETIESMSHGGHPHNQHPPRHPQSHSNHKESSSRNTTPLSSPPQPRLSPPGVPLVDSETDMGQYKATLPALTGDEFLPLSSIASTKTCQLALNALLENHRESQRLAAQPALALTSVPTPLSMTSPPIYLADMTLNPSALAMNTAYSRTSSTQRRKLSTTALLGMVSTHELLESCQYSDTDISNGYSTPASTVTSPATTHQSLSSQSSPTSKMVDFQGAQSGNSPMALTAAAFEMLVAQTPALLAEGDISKQMLLHDYHQQRQDPVLDSSPTLSDASTTSNPFIEFLQDLRTPFTYFSSHSDPLISGTHSSPWPSLFPSSSDSTPIAEASPQCVEKTTQTEALDEDSLAVVGRGVLKDAAATPSKFLVQEEQDPEWLAFLDEASPLFSAESGVGDPSMMDFAVPTELHESQSSKIDTKQDDIRQWSRAEGAFKPQTTDLRGHFGFAAVGGGGGAFRSMGSLGAGGMVRSLRGNYQQRSGYHTKAASSRIKELASIKPLESGPEAVNVTKKLGQEDSLKKMSGGERKSLKREVRSSPSPAIASSSVVTKDKANMGEADNFKGLVAMFHGLWRASTGERD
ncbi:hypothetical protein BGZ70_010230 [Mortierella alpina]|uniref:Uncharacterized protein n=1 Tax=Mortierella alpina TaxID=64518 RepID=A0A9P6IZK3_MORAP|nr:hypothetical protein BGZ70_010230 [Mortierella alpina]